MHLGRLVSVHGHFPILVQGHEAFEGGCIRYQPDLQKHAFDPKIHPLVTSSQIIGGKISFLVLGARRATIAAQPQLPAVIEQALDEAARLIHDDPRRAAQIYLTHEPSGTINGAAMEAVVKDIQDEFGSAVYGMQTMAEFMGRHGELKIVPKSWKELVAPAMLNSPSS